MLWATGVPTGHHSVCDQGDRHQDDGQVGSRGQVGGKRHAAPVDHNNRRDGRHGGTLPPLSPREHSSGQGSCRAGAVHLVGSPAPPVACSGEREAVPHITTGGRKSACPTEAPAPQRSPFCPFSNSFATKSVTVVTSLHSL